MSNRRNHIGSHGISDAHPLLAQLPLTVSPFISLPSAPTLPYTYKPLPSTLPPSSTADAQGIEREKYVVAPSRHTAHPDEIRASCQTLQSHILKNQEDAEKTLQAWEEDLRAQDLAEKRKVAPGWLDRAEKILEPKRASLGHLEAAGTRATRSDNIMDQQMEPQSAPKTGSEMTGEELDRAFGGMSIDKR